MKVMLTRFQRLPLYLLSALSLTACEVELAHRGGSAISDRTAP